MSGIQHTAIQGEKYFEMSHVFKEENQNIKLHFVYHLAVTSFLIHKMIQYLMTFTHKNCIIFFHSHL